MLKAQPAATACPFSAQARAFDPFGPAYSADPAEALRWSRDAEPVFFSEAMGYWVVSRYDDIKAVFRDNITFSPANALEKITPATPEALAVLKREGYGMNRTLVNEDEPAHMARRRLLLDAFAPEALAAHAPMVRKLVRAKLDAIIDRGHSDLVEDMLWDVPLTVALEFLGVPEDDMVTLRGFSVAHTVNTWGKPTPEQQVAVAEGVAKFWNYSGEVLARMSAQVDAGEDVHGWMYDMIRQNREFPEIVTDSYLHSMMMAIIVAAHETTALASANALRQLLTHRAQWQAICDDPALIPAAVEECLRHSGSMVAWRRIAAKDAQVGGVTIPKGGKILMVMASANHDPRHFENPDQLDIWRDNAADHLTFGYGAHQCMGKNIGRMEMAIILEELTRRIPHLQLEAQDFTYLPNISLRGPEALRVRWDVAQNPERADPALREGGRDFPVGAPDRKAIVRQLTVSDAAELADGVLGITLTDPSGAPLPSWTPGAHIDIVLPEGGSRKYSLCGPAGSGDWRIAVLRDEAGRGGSRWMHDHARAGAALRVRGPHNHFRLEEDAPHHILIAGGIGITPIMAMADRLRALGRDYALHYAGRARGRMAFLDRARADHGERLHLHVSEDGGRADLAALVADAPAGSFIAACGPARLLDALDVLVAARPDLTLRFEHFASDDSAADMASGQPFQVVCADSDLTLDVPEDRSLLQTLRAAGLDVPSDCEEGLCGSCELAVAAGEIDHRDRVLTAGERAGADRIITCCSRGKGRLVLKI
ncbi:cytochrome P450/oxidoreductase [Paracoccus xiamenensis]|uniref:cytochrome P450/oxidoreductase n=1 Tax=Paracoccus xiamenensis TaxID=2714901 RepID=UPI00140BD4EB|nr:cytochrome P450/oxidoreductase [Paracoccus xiamenensis]NHF72846.1 cytochrome P450 [Paracoccus xiamenensis]